MTWLYDGRPLTEDEVNNNFGFVYEIEHIPTGVKYIGRKNFFVTKSRQVNKKKKKYKVESDWQDYWSSSEILKEQVEEFGKDQYKRTVLRLCKTVGELKYWETKYQFLRNVLEARLPNGEFEYLNKNIVLKFTRNNIGMRKD